MDEVGWFVDYIPIFFKIVRNVAEPLFVLLLKGQNDPLSMSPSGMKRLGVALGEDMCGVDPQ